MTLAVMKIWTVLLKKEEKKEKTSKNKKGVKTVTKINTNKSTGGYSQGTFPSVNRQLFSTGGIGCSDATTTTKPVARFPTLARVQPVSECTQSRVRNTV